MSARVGRRRPAVYSLWHYRKWWCGPQPPETRHRTAKGVRSSWDCSTGFAVAAPGVADGRDPAADLNYLRQWVAEHDGVEAFVEPKTTVTEVTVVLVAADGEWTRRRAGGDSGARRLSDRLQDPRLRRAEGRLPPADARPRRAAAHLNASARNARANSKRADRRPRLASRCSAMSSSTANMVRVGTPVPPLPV